MAKQHPWTLLLLLLIIIISNSDCSSILGPDDPDLNWNRHESARYLVYVRPNSYAEQNINRLLEDLEAHYTYVLSVLEINYTGRIIVFFYDSAQDAGRRGGMAGPRTETVVAVCSPGESGLFTAAQHEVTHVITHNALGEPGTYFMSEGTAMSIAMPGTWRFWNGSPLDLCARQMIISGQMPSLNALIDNGQWGKLESDITYPASGSFLLYLIERFGSGPIKQLFNTSSRDFPNRFKETTGFTLEDIESAWKAFLTGV